HFIIKHLKIDEFTLQSCGTKQKIDKWLFVQLGYVSTPATGLKNVVTSFTNNVRAVENAIKLLASP
ncbi:hypothetical protein, partial [Heyndrickxia coagulans]|uniref:hypothetical protein n=1 Tax=Heyndrickxia coagulans TaxID=1398 RepID=UPI001F4872EB